MTTASKITLVRVVLIPVFMVFLILSANDPTLRWAALGDVRSGEPDAILSTVRSPAAAIRSQISANSSIRWRISCWSSSCLIIFVGQGRMLDWIVFIVVAREFAISGLRMVAANNGKVIAAGWSGKIKTASTMVGLAAHDGVARQADARPRCEHHHPCHHDLLGRGIFREELAYPAAEEGSILTLRGARDMMCATKNCISR